MRRKVLSIIDSSRVSNFTFRVRELSWSTTNSVRSPQQNAELWPDCRHSSDYPGKNLDTHLPIHVKEYVSKGATMDRRLGAVD